MRTHSSSQGLAPTRGLEWVPVLFGLAAMFVPSIVDLARNYWSSEEQMHGPIILVVTLYLFWDLRNTIQDAPVVPRGILGWSLFSIGMLLFIIGHSQGIILFELGSLLWILPALMLMMRGTGALKATWFPIFFLFFMIPLPGAVVDALTLPMKTGVSWAVEHILFALGYPISRSGVILYMGQYQLLVANACAGLHTLFSLEALGLLYLHLTKHESWGRNTALAIFIIPISFTANVIRVLTLTLVTYYFGDEAGQGFLHGFAGMVLFISALLLIITIDSAIQFFLNLRRNGGEAILESHVTDSTSSPPRISPWLELRKKSAVVSSCLFLAVGLALVMEPKPIPLNEQPDLERLIPKSFGDWSIDPSMVPILPSPDQQAQVAEVYDQMVNRTYVNRQGRRMMISIAYGSRQDQKLKAHRQEVCYASQGFQIRRISHQTARVAGAEITVTRMFAVSKAREEPVTYWFTVGSQVVQSRIQRLLVQLQYGLTGSIPDGILVRVSNLSSNEQLAYQEHIEFINAMLETIPPDSRSRFVGNSYH